MIYLDLSFCKYVFKIHLFIWVSVYKYPWLVIIFATISPPLMRVKTFSIQYIIKTQVSKLLASVETCKITFGFGLSVLFEPILALSYFLWLTTIALLWFISKIWKYICYIIISMSRILKYFYMQIKGKVN